APADEERKTRIVSDNSDRAALTVVDLKQCAQLKLAHRQFARFLAREVQRLLQPGPQPKLVFEQRDKSRELQAGDICILVLTRRHPARQLYQYWLALAEGRQWSALFQSLLEETGVLLRDDDAVDTERRRASFRHLLGTLEQVGHGENRDLLGLLDWIKARRQQ